MPDILFHGGIEKDQIFHQPLLGSHFDGSHQASIVKHVHTIDCAFDGQNVIQPFAPLHTAFPLFEVVPVKGEEFVPLRQLFVAPLAHVHPGAESVHDDVTDRGVHKLADPKYVAPYCFKQPELKPHILHRPVGVALGQLDRGGMLQQLCDPLESRNVWQKGHGAVQRIGEVLLRPLGRFAQVTDEAIEFGEITVDHFLIGSFHRSCPISVSGSARLKPELFCKISPIRELPTLNAVLRVNPQGHDRFKVGLDGGVEVNGLLANLHGVQETAERLGHEKIFLIGDLTDVFGDFVMPSFRLTGRFIFFPSVVRLGGCLRLGSRVGGFIDCRGWLFLLRWIVSAQCE